MSGQEGSKPDLTSLLAVLIGKLYAVLEQFDSKVASGQQNPQAVRVGSLLIAKAFTVYGMFKLAYIISVPSCERSLIGGIEAVESVLKGFSEYLAQDQPDIARVGKELELLSTDESVLVSELLMCMRAGKQA